MVLQRSFLLCNYNPDVYVQLTVKHLNVETVLSNTISFFLPRGKAELKPKRAN